MKPLAFVACCFLLAGCHGSDKNEVMKGLVTDVTANSVTIISEDNDTLSFSIVNSDKTALSGLLVGDTIEVCFAGTYISGMDAKSLTTVSKAMADDYARFFNEGIRTEAVDGETGSMYICFTEDSLRAELFTPSNGSKEVLEQRTLPSGEHVWNIEDDDTKNVRYADNCWSISRRGKLLFKQHQSDTAPQLGVWQNVQYEGVLPAADCPGIKYQLYIKHREHSGDGSFLLRMTYLEGENGKDVVYSYTGKRHSLRGIPKNPNAIVWQLVPDNDDSKYNLLYDAREQTLTFLNNQFEPVNSELNYKLEKVG